MDWQAWHRAYDDPTSALAQRRACVQRHVRARLDAGPARLLSLCAGDGADVLGVLRPTDEVSGRLVELDPDLAASARSAAVRATEQAAGRTALDVVCADAGWSDAYAGAVPADLLLLCGIFGNIVDADIRTCIEAVPQLCAPGAWVVWTRGRHGDGRGPQDPGVDPRGDLTPAIRGWFAAVGCAEVAFDAPGESGWSVGVHRFDGEPALLEPGRRVFAFSP